MVANIQRWRADGHSHRKNYANFVRTWLTMKNHDNMHNLLPLYYIVTKGKALLHFRLVSLLLYLV